MVNLWNVKIDRIKTPNNISRNAIKNVMLLKTYNKLTTTLLFTAFKTKIISKENELTKWWYLILNAVLKSLAM